MHANRSGSAGLIMMNRAPVFGSWLSALSCVGEVADLASAFDCTRNVALVFCAGSGLAARKNLCLGTQETPERFRVFHIRCGDIIVTKHARFDSGDGACRHG